MAVNERYVYSATCSKILLLSYRKARWMENKLGGGRGACVPVRSTEWNMGRIGGGEEERKRRRERERERENSGWPHTGIQLPRKKTRILYHAWATASDFQ